MRPTRASDFPAIIALTESVYPNSQPWSEAQLASHLAIFPEGQLVAESDGALVGMAASLIVRWDDYGHDANWRDFTSRGTFVNHDPIHGRTLYGAEVMVKPGLQGLGIGKALYRARRQLVERFGLLRIRAGSRLRGYHRYADEMDPEKYVEQVVRGELGDPTLSFQLRQGFRVLAVVSSYLRNDPESRGFAAVIEWLNPAIATPEDYAKGNPRFRVPESAPSD